MANRNQNAEERWQRLNRRAERYYPRENDLGDRTSNRDRVWQDIRYDESQDPRLSRQGQGGYQQGSRGQAEHQRSGPWQNRQQQGNQSDNREWNDYQNRERGWANDPYYSRYETGQVYDWDDRYNENWDYNNWLGPYYGVGPKNYQRTDQRIEEDINERLTRHGQIDATHIQVQVKDGEVTLDGAVKNRGEKRIAERVADSVSGVKDVFNNLKIQSA